MGAYSKTYDDIIDAVISPCDIFPVANGKPVHTENALWDTGSMCTFLSARIIQEMQLQPYGKDGVSGIGGIVETDTYLVHLRLPSGDVITNFEVMANDYDDYDMIIGMDVIMHGDFHIDNSSGRSIFTFQIPKQ